MRRGSLRRSLTLAIAAGVLTVEVEASAQAICFSEPLAVQILGSGGPYAGGTRASAGSLVWRAGRGRGWRHRAVHRVSGPLVVSHFIEAPSTVQTPECFSLFDLDQAVGEVRKHFARLVDTAVDLQCIPIR